MSLRLTMNISTGSMSGKTQRLLKRLKQDFQSFTEMDAGEYLKRLKDKEKALDATNLKWYYVLMVYGSPMVCR